MSYLKQVLEKEKLSFLVVVALIIFLGSLKFIFQQANILSFDYFGLYLYLPATFIYHDPGISDLSWLEQINATYQNTPNFYQLHAIGGNNIIRFFCGMSILLMPFFFIGHGLAHLTAYPTDGFSYPYQLAMMLAAFFYVAVGLIYSRKVLLKFFDDRITAITLLAMYLGTNLFFWTTFDAGAPHTLLFTLYAMLLWFTIRWHEKPKISYAIVIGLLLGLIIVSRPGEIIAVLIPLFWNIYNWESFKTKFFLVLKHFHHVILLVFFTVLPGLPQIAYYELYTGYVYYNTYTDPQSGLDFSNPRFSWVLFSYRKGWFVYAPMMIFAIVGFAAMLKKNSRPFLSLMTHFLLNLVLIASFTSLVSYGWRAFIQSYALLIIPLGFFIQFLSENVIKITKYILMLILAFFILLTIFQGWQTMAGIIDGSRMTKAYYWKIFGQIAPNEKDRELLLIDRYMDDNNGGNLPKHIQYQSRNIQYYDFQSSNSSKADSFVDPLDSTNQVFMLSKEKPWSPGVKKANAEISQAEHYWAEISGRFLTDSVFKEGDLVLIATYTYRGKNVSNKGKVYKYRAFNLTPDIPGKWKDFSFKYLAPEATTQADRFETYIWYRGENTAFVDDFKVNILEPMPD